MGYCLTYVIDLLNLYDDLFNSGDQLGSVDARRKRRQEFRRLCNNGGMTFGEGEKFCKKIRSGSYKVTYLGDNKKNCSCKVCSYDEVS